MSVELFNKLSDRNKVVDVADVEDDTKLPRIKVSENKGELVLSKVKTDNIIYGFAEGEVVKDDKTDGFKIKIINKYIFVDQNRDDNKIYKIKLPEQEEMLGGETRRPSCAIKTIGHPHKHNGGTRRKHR